MNSVQNDMHSQFSLRSCLNRKIDFWSPFVWIVFIGLFPLFPLIAQSGEEILSAAVYEEEIKGDLDAAINLYAQIIKNTSNDRRIIAEAYYRLGYAHEKLGTQNALYYYGELIAKFIDQTTFVKKAEERLRRISSNQKSQSVSNGEGRFNPGDEFLKTTKVFSFPNFYGTISPNGHYFSFVNWVNGNLFIFDRLTGEERELDTQAWYHKGNWVDRSIWSPDNKKILYCWIHQSVDSQLKIYDLENNRINELTPILENSIIWPLEWTRDGKFILSSHYDRIDSTYKIVLVSVSDGHIGLVKNFEKNRKCNDCYMSISPEGKNIIYDRISDNGNSDLYIISTDGSNDRPLLENPSKLRIAKWLNSNSFLYFNDISGSNALWRANLSSDMSVRDTELILAGLTPENISVGLTENGSFYYLQSSNTGDIYTGELDVKSGKLESHERVRSDNPNSRFSAFWSPKGRKLAFFRTHDAFLGHHELVILDINSQEEKELRFDIGPLERRFGKEHNAAWSPNGRNLIFSYWNYDHPQVVLVDPASGKYNEINVQSWEKTFGKNGEIYHVGEDSNGSTIIRFYPASGDKQIIYQSANLYIDHLAVSNKGDQLAFVERTKLSPDGTDHLKVVDLKKGETTGLVIFNERERISDFAGINWLHDDGAILLSATMHDESSQQLYAVDVNSGNLKPIGEAIQGEENFMRAIRLHPIENKISFGRLSFVKNIWSLENIK